MFVNPVQNTARLFLSYLFIVTMPLVMIPVSSHAQTQGREVMENTQYQARASEIYKQLRCVTCAGQSLADSEAEMALSLRALVRQQLRTGATNEEIFAYIQARYGDSVLMRPPMKKSTWVLWLAPLLALLLMIGLSLSLYRKPEKEGDKP